MTSLRIPPYIRPAIGGLLVGGFALLTPQVLSSGHGALHVTAMLQMPLTAVGSLLPFAFQTLRLHRVEAACLPANAASIRLLEKRGFRREGFAREYLCIDGVWQDHLLYARLKHDPSP